MIRTMVHTIGLFIALVALGACGSGVGNDGAIVGGACAVNNECDIDSRCLTGAGFPGGYCARTCTSDEDCPEGSACADEEGGVCMVACGGSGECRSDEGYECVERAARDGAGATMVCATP